MWYCLTTSFPGPLPLLARVKVLGMRLTVYYAVLLYKVVLTFRTVDETLVCDHFFESY